MTMIDARTSHLAKIGAAIAVAFVLMAIIVGCGSQQAATPAKAGSTAKEGLPVAQSAMTTAAPDAKLLLVQTATGVTPTSTPVWTYLFGSPSSGKTYVVYVANGKTMNASEYGTAGLSKSEWAKVPTTDAWKIDSNTAYQTALTASGAKAAPPTYNMGLLTYIPASETSSTTKPFVWYISLAPNTSGITTGSVEVDAQTGAVIKPKP